MMPFAAEHEMAMDPIALTLACTTTRLVSLTYSQSSETMSYAVLGFASSTSTSILSSFT